MEADLDYLRHLAQESARFGEAIREAAPDAPVASCPEWTADDLLWHLGEVQWFWGTVVRERLPGPQVGDLAPERPADRAGLQAFYRRVSADLGDALAATAPDTPAWTWAEDQTVGFVRRRQAHEALIHRIDAELAAGHRTPMDPQLSADGVDEALRVMYGGGPAWASFAPYPGQGVRLRAIDTADTWLVAVGQLTGTDPADQVSYDQPGIVIADTDRGAAAAAEVSGSAADLDCWLWHRPPAAPVDKSGDGEVLGRFESVLAGGIE
jgi:uncharacterized protein (TIGR03083 family)